MKITRNDLDQAAEQGLIQTGQVEPLYQFLRSRQDPDTRLNLTNTLYYLGGFLAIGALTLFMNLGWEQFGGWGIPALCGVYALGAVALTETFRHRQLVLPAALASVFVVVLTPLAIYGFQQGMGWWDAEREYRDYHRVIQPLWLWMELGTLVVGALVFNRYRYPLLIMPLAVTLWYLSMDLADWIVGEEAGFRERAWLTMWLGLLVLAFAFWVDLGSRHQYDYAWWLYLAGVLAFWGGMTAQDSDSELAKFFYCCVNLLMMLIGVVLKRRVFLLFGALGVSFYLGHLAWTVFEDSWLFPISMIALGLGIVYLGLIWQRNEVRLTLALRQCLPDSLRRLLEHRDI